MHSRWPRLDGLAYGGEYYPEQWPEEVWHEGIPTAAVPPWFLRRHPEARPVTRDGLPVGGGTRQVHCPSSPAYAAAAGAITRQLAVRYGTHPGVVLWHVNNEYGAPLGECYCETSAAAFRDWLRNRYGDIATLNEHWGAAFWSQRYGEWDEIDPPKSSGTVVNPALRLDYARFSSDALLACFRRERDILRELSPGIPVTTNFMATNCKPVDYWRWAPEVDVISNDNYLIAERPDSYIDLAMSADMTRSLAEGGPWLLMEHSTSAVSWQPRNIAKRPGEMRRNSLAHVARGADGALFFQWRASRFGAEKHHSAMLPHGGTATRIWREVVELGAEVGDLKALRGTRVEPDLAILWDWESWWAQELEWRPSVDLVYTERIRAWYEAAWRAGLTADFAHPGADLSRYPLVVAPALYLITPQAAASLRRYVEGGGTLVVGCFSGIVDAWDRVHPGAYPGALRDVLGVRVEEWLPLRAGEQVALTWEEAVLPEAGGAAAAASPGAGGAGTGRADAWTEAVTLAGAKPVGWYAGGPADGGPAVTRHDLGEGQAWYVSARTDQQTTATLLAAACEAAGIAPGITTPVRPVDGTGWPRDLEVTRRAGGGSRFITLINHGEDGADVLLDGRLVSVPSGEVLVIKGDT
jgi:beta-galactosidase